MLTYARALRLRDDPAHAAKTSLVRRGNVVVLFVILLTLGADAIAEIVVDMPPSDSGTALRVGLASMFLLSLTSVLVVAMAFGRVSAVAPPPDLTPADGMDDLWTIVRIPVANSSRFLPTAVVAWVQGFDSDRLFTRARWLSPRRHPWRFASLLSLAAAIGFAVAQLREGLPANLGLGVLLSAIFVSGEFAIVFGCFALLGGYLGLRPPLRSRPGGA